MSSTRPAEAQPPAVLFLHGFSMDHRVWRRQVEALHPELRVITVDLPGFGPQARDCGLVSPAEQVERAVAKAKLPKVHLVGQSFGAAVAIDFAFSFPQHVASLTLVGPLMLGRRTGIEAWGRCVSLANEGDVTTALDVWLDDPLYEGLRRDDDLFDEVRNIVLDYGAAHWLGRVTNRWSDPDPFPRLAEIEKPTLVVSGGLDIPSFRAMADAYCKGLPNARREEIPNVGHLVNVEAAARFNELVRDFVLEVEKGT